MKIVFQNEYFVAVDKDPSVLTVPARFADDPRPILGRDIEKLLGRTIFPVHRLDAEVTGLVLFALTAEAHREANGVFENRQVKKIYQAFSVGGAFATGDEGQWKAQILKGKKRAYESPAGKQAVTDFKVVAIHPNPASEGSGSVIEWRLHPLTGRSHQLRWELYRHQSPICGDVLYGSEVAWAQGGVALRSISLEFLPEFAEKWKTPSRLEVPCLSIRP